MSKKVSGTTNSDIDLTGLDLLEAPKEEIVITPEDIKSVSKVDYPSLKKRMDAGEVLMAVTNDSEQPFVTDWNLELLPTDIDSDFNKYLQDKYVQYELKELIKDFRVVVIFQEGRSINFLESFLAEKRFPTLVPRPSGKDVVMKPSLVINSKSTVIMTRKQADALSSFEKIKKVWEVKGVKKETPWLGFLKMKTLKDPKDLFNYDISIVSEKDLRTTSEDIREGRVVHSRRQAGIIREEE
jgi:hypothetical protein